MLVDGRNKTCCRVTVGGCSVSYGGCAPCTNIAMRALLFGASVAFAVAATNKCLEAKAEEAAVCDQTGLISDPALAYSAYCSTACAEALLKIRHWCPDICSADMSTEAAYSVYASDRLAKCDNCIGASVEVAAKCGTDLGKTGDDAVATYCTDEQCSYALQKQAAYCVTSSSLADDKIKINPYAAFVSGSITFQTNADALKVQAVAALEHCAPSSTGVNPEDLLQSNRKSAELWTEFLQRYYATSTPCAPRALCLQRAHAAPRPWYGPPLVHDAKLLLLGRFTSIQEALQSIAPGLTLCSATSGTCPEGCDSCGSMEMTMATCPKRWTEAKLAKCVGSGTWSGGSPGSGTCTVPNNAECTLLHSAGGDAVCTQSSDDISVDCPNRQEWPKVCGTCNILSNSRAQPRTCS